MHTNILVLLALLLLTTALPAAALEARDIKVDGWTLTILGQALQIEPLPLVNGKCEVELKDGTPGWQGPFLMPGPAWAYSALRPETLTATLSADPKIKLVAGKDFALDAAWAAVAALPGSAYPAGTKVSLAYQYALSRIDLIEQADDGKLTVLKGVADKGQPRFPERTPGRKLLASVVLLNDAVTLSPAMVNPVDEAYDGRPPVFDAEHINPFRDALATSRPLTIVFFGDSITAQQPKDFRDGKGSFVDRFVAHLKQARPDRTVVACERGVPVPEPKDGQTLVIKAGVGGNDTRMALKRIDADVLGRKPDLTVVMFGVNDENRKGEGNSVPVPEYKANMATIVDKVLAGGSAVIIMTPSMKNRGWSATSGNMAEYAQAARDVAKDKKVCLVDNYRAWELLPKQGYHYMILLGNCINHPVDLGHDLFFRGLDAALFRSRP